jgi:hypothetical protein
MPNGRLNPNFTKLAGRRAHEVAFLGVRVDLKPIIAPLKTFVHENHYDLNNKIMMDIFDERETIANKNQQLWAKGTRELGMTNTIKTMEEYNTMAIAANTNAKGKGKDTRKPGQVGVVRPKSYHNTLGLFECLWDTTEPPLSPIKKYGYALSKKKDIDETEVFTKKNGRDMVFKEEWDPESVFNAHFGTPVVEQNPLGASVLEKDQTVEGMSGRSLSRQALRSVGLTRKLRATGGLDASRPESLSPKDKKNKSKTMKEPRAATPSAISAFTQNSSSGFAKTA